MATTAVDRVFVDTNVVVFASVPAAPLHALALQRLHDLKQAGVELWFSRQVVREFLVVVTRPQSFLQPLSSAAAAIEAAKLLSLFAIAEDGPGVMSNLLTLCSSIPMGGKQIHDANIVATMQAHGIGKLLTDNTGDFNRFQGVITIVPLVP
jgi:predicted nucleic acid-binding protein